MFTSCATIVDPSSKKSFRNTWNDEVVWNGKIYKKTFWGGQYDVDNMFDDDQKSKKLIIKANKQALYGRYFILGGLLGAIGYGVSSIADNSYKSSNYWTIIGVGYISGIVLEIIARKNVDKAIDGYNQRKGYSLSPMIFNIDKKRRVGLNMSVSF